MVDGLEQSCGRSVTDPPGGDTTTCTTPVGFTGKILRIQPHMHLLGTGMKVTLDPGTPRQQVLLDDTAYNFDYQRSFDMPKPVPVTPVGHHLGRVHIRPHARTGASPAATPAAPLRHVG